jgi:hypothetical protein
MKIRIILTILIALTLLTNIIPIFVISEKTNITIYVDDDNIDGPWDGSYEHPFQHIQDGINVSNTFDTIFIRNGIYSEYLKITKEIYLIGEDNTNTILQSNKIEEQSQFDRIITIYADNVQIKNLCIRPYNNVTMNNVNAIYAENSRELIIQNNHIINCYSGILLDTNSSAGILDNHIQFYNGIPLRCIYFVNSLQDSVIVISGNRIISYGDGIDFNFYKTAPSQIIIDHNHIESPFGQNSPNSFDSGIWFSHAVDTNYNLVISHNNITGFTFGVYYLGGGSPLDESSINIFLNSFYNEISDLYLLPNSIKSNEPFVITNNNFYGENQQELFIEEIILDPFFIPFLINYSLGLIQKNSIQWISNYWHHHETLLSKLIPGKMFIYLKFPILVIEFTIFQEDPSPANTPFII